MTLLRTQLGFTLNSVRFSLLRPPANKQNLRAHGEGRSRAGETRREAAISVSLKLQGLRRLGHSSLDLNRQFFLVPDGLDHAFLD